jgi:hypothetical protein
VEAIAPGKMRVVTEYENGSTSLAVLADNQQCVQSNNNQEWFCLELTLPDFRDKWIRIVKGQTSPGLGDRVIKEHGSRLDVWEGKPCRLYYTTELLQPEGQLVSTYEMCFDLSTYYPMYLVEVHSSLVDGEVQEGTRIEVQFRDFNTPI